MREYTDSDYVGKKEIIRNLVVHMYTCCNSCVNCKSQLKKNIVLSSTEAEYFIATDAIKNGIWLKSIVT